MKHADANEVGIPASDFTKWLRDKYPAEMAAAEERARNGESNVECKFEAAASQIVRMDSSASGCCESLLQPVGLNQ
jgi:hypothetical protein